MQQRAKCLEFDFNCVPAGLMAAWIERESETRDLVLEVLTSKYIRLNENVLRACIATGDEHDWEAFANTAIDIGNKILEDLGRSSPISDSESNPQRAEMHDRMTGIGPRQSNAIENLDQYFKSQQDAVSLVAEKSAPKPIFNKSYSKPSTVPYDLDLRIKLVQSVDFREPKKGTLEIEEVSIEEMDLPDEFDVDDTVHVVNGIKLEQEDLYRILVSR